MRKVHAIHATSVVGFVTTGTGGEGEGEFEMLSFPKFREEEGREVESGWAGGGADLIGILMGALIDARGTPHSEQTAEEVRPTGFRLLHTSHSQNSTFLVGADVDGVCSADPIYAADWFCGGALGGG